MSLGISGTLTRAALSSPLTPLFLLAALAIGTIALISLPREEEPQISVPMVDIHVVANGLKADEAVELVTKPLEAIVKGIDGVEHVYSQTVDDGVLVTARFYVGTDQDTAILRVHEKIRANYDRIPLGIPEPLIVGRGINDVAIVTLTLSPDPAKPGAADRFDDRALYTLATELQSELTKVDQVGLTYVVGGRPAQIRVEPDPEKLALYGVTLNQLIDKVRNANRSFNIGLMRQDGQTLPVLAGQTLQGIPDISLLLLTTRDGRPVYVGDVANIVVGARPDEHRAWDITKGPDGKLQRVPAVTLAIAKRAGANAVVIADNILQRLSEIRGRLIPGDVKVTVTRDYGATASEKANELLFHLGLATLTIVGLVVLTIGWRAGTVVFVVIPTTILLTMFASWLMGYTINRVSLFALIFSIGILVDDAIVVIENIDRHWSMNDGRTRTKAAIDAVAEVGNPTIIATLTVIAALLPMMFVSGMMGPYMSPIPANASAAMLFSFFVSVVVAPWLMLRLAGKAPPPAHVEHHEGFLGRLFRRVATPILKTKRRSWIFLGVTGGLTVLSCVLFYTKDVTVKLLPFDNKSELQVVVDMPANTSLETTERTLVAMADKLADLPEMSNMQLYAGTAAPFNFNGLVRHYYLRNKPEQGDLQVNLADKSDRSRESHEIALDVRHRLSQVPVPDGTVVRVVEVPPGPPVLSTLLAEVYGPTPEARREAARRLTEAFRKVDFVVDVDNTVRDPGQRLRYSIDQESLEYNQVEESALYDTLGALLGGVSVGYSHRGPGIYPIEITVRMPTKDMEPSLRIQSTPLPSLDPGTGGPGVVELGQVVKLNREKASYPIFRHNGEFAEMVQAELAGRYEAPIYGMLAVEDNVAAQDWGPAGPPHFSYHGQPRDTSVVSFLWDGEWEITYVTFRDMGIAFGAAILGIYLLVVGQFRSFKVPLLILVPVPLTLVGILVGHWLLSAAFTATSMIGFIALAGIIVRNSILLVDFIRHRRQQGVPLREALLDAGAVRFKPIFLTAVAAMIGAGFILLDPIFQGLAVSLLFGLASSTALTVLVIPAIYIVLRGDREPPVGKTAAPPSSDAPQAS